MLGERDSKLGSPRETGKYVMFTIQIQRGKSLQETYTKCIRRIFAKPLVWEELKNNAENNAFEHFSLTYSQIPMIR